MKYAISSFLILALSAQSYAAPMSTGHVEVVTVKTAAPNNKESKVPFRIPARHDAARSEIFPPSRYIGIYDEYLGFQNGGLPKTNQIFTGTWTYSENGALLIEGQYTNGIPAGAWKEYSDGGIVRRQCEYADNNAFTETAYWPDGTPRLIVSGICFWLPEGVRRLISSVKRMDGAPQAGAFPENRIAPCHFFLSNECVNNHFQCGFDKHHKGYLTFQENEFRFRSFQYDAKASQWECDVLDGTVDWENQTMEIQRQPLKFPYEILMDTGNVQCMKVVTPSGSSRMAIDKPNGNAAWTPTDVNSENDSGHPLMYITERHWLTDLEFSNAETGNYEKIPFQVVLSGFYMPGSGWSDVMVESAGMSSHTINFPSLFDKFESHSSPGITQKPLPPGITLFVDYWGNNAAQNKRTKDTFNQDITLMYEILLEINYPEKGNLSWVTSFNTELKRFSFEKYRASYHPAQLETEAQDNP